MAWLKVILLVLILHWGPAGIHAQMDDDYVCQEQDAHFLNQTLQELKAALSHRPLDLIFIMDISGSIDDADFNKIRLFALELFNYAASECDMFIHPDYTRTEFILFDHRAELHVANYSRHIHGCEFLNILENLERPDRRGATYIARAMGQALQTFRTHSRDRPVDSQVLFILTDGEFYDSAFDIELMRTRLAGQEVKTYTVGVGSWLNNPRREENVRALASNNYNYACVNEWLLLLNPGKAKYKPSKSSHLQLDLNMPNNIYVKYRRYYHNTVIDYL